MTAQASSSTTTIQGTGGQTGLGIPGTGDATGTNGSNQLRRSNEASASIQTLIDLLNAPTGLTAEELIARAEIDVNNCDTQIKGLVDQMNDRARNGANLRAIMDRFQAWAADPNVHDGDHFGMEDPHNTVTITRTDGSTEQVTIKRAMEECGLSPQDIANFSSGDHTHLDAARTVLTGATQSLTENSEQVSLTLQTLVSRRSQVLQMTSQMIASMSETSKGITQQIGH